MRMIQILCIALIAIFALQTQAGANDRYREKPPVVLSPDLTAPWVMQLKPNRKARKLRRTVVRQRVQQRRVIRSLPRARQERRRPSFAVRKKNRRNTLQTAAVAAPTKKSIKRALDPAYLPQQVSYPSNHKAGTIVIDTNQRFLYLVQAGGKARRYGVGVGKPGFEWAGTHKITQKKHWPDWRPPAEMIAREKKKGRILPRYMPGGPANPLGARALYLGSTLYRIHGTNQPWTIGRAVSSGCIRMRNEDVVDLYERVKTGTKVIVM